MWWVRILILSVLANAYPSFGLHSSIMTPRMRRTLRSKRWPPSPSALSQYKEDKAALPLKSLAIGLVAGLGVFGTGFVSVLGKASRDNQEQIQAPKLKQSSTDGGERRGAMTRLTRKEIQGKLQQLPVFFATQDKDKGLVAFVSEEGKGYFFMNADDAETYAKANGCIVSVTTLDDVYYTLLVKKTKLATYLGGVAGSSPPDATYVLKPSTRELANVGLKWVEAHPNDIPLYRVQNLAFNKAEWLEIPLFTNKADGVTSFNRLEEDEKRKEKKDVPKTDIQVTSLRDMIQIFSQGGVEGRAIEFYPSAENIEQAAKFSAIRG